MFWSLTCGALRYIVQVLVLVLRGDRSAQIEVLVLRHQVAVRAARFTDRIFTVAIESFSPRCRGCCTAAREARFS